MGVEVEELRRRAGTSSNKLKEIHGATVAGIEHDGKKPSKVNRGRRKKDACQA